MAFEIFSTAFLDDLTARAVRSPRRRQHHNVHATYADPVQRLFNAIGMDSYIRPHRHCLDPKRECLMAVRGRMALIAFDEDGSVIDCVIFGAGQEEAAGVEVDPSQWHTVLALTPGAILFEVKAGPFDADAAKEFAPWSPAEDGPESMDYLLRLHAAASAGDR